jgi:serine/threonine protein kinase
MSEYKYKKLDSIELNSSSVIIDEGLKSSLTKEVYRVISNLADKKQHILKAIYTKDSEASNTIDFYIRDENRYFMEVIDFYKDDTKTFLLLKYYHDKTIYEYIPKYEPDDKYRVDMIFNILEIGCYLHKNNYIHGDIKPDNFFIDRDRVRLGDLEAMVKLDDINEDTIETLSGTQGFKYSNTNKYTLRDEVFAYVATIYYIEVGELLITKDDFRYLTKEDNPFKAINNQARENIESISQDSIKNFLLNIIDELESGYEVDCCSMLEQFKDIREEEERKKEPKKWKKSLLFTLIGLAIITLIIYLSIQNRVPSCDKAYFINDTIIAIQQKNGSIKFYDKIDDKYIYIKNERVLKLIDKERLFRNSKGKDIECKDGKVHIF